MSLEYAALWGKIGGYSIGIMGPHGPGGHGHISAFQDVQAGAYFFANGGEYNGERLPLNESWGDDFFINPIGFYVYYGW